MAETTSLDPVRVGLIASEPLRMEGLRGIFDRQPVNGQAGLVPVVGALEEMLANSSIGLLVMDLNSCSAPLDTLRKIHHAKPSAKLIVIGPDQDDELVMEAILAGARAFVDVTAGPKLIREAIQVVLAGSIWAPRRSLARLIDRLLADRQPQPAYAVPHLTVREQQVLDLILQARSNREIAVELGIEERTVKSHVGKLMRKIGADNRIALSMRALSGPAAAKKAD